MLDARKLRLLRDLARLGTIAAVAQAHSYTASAVSQQLAALEREAGAALFERTGRGITLTPAGRLLVQHAHIVLGALEEASAALADASAGLSGPLRIGAFPTAVRTLLPAALVELSGRHPGLELRVSDLDPVSVPDALRERRIDIGLVQDYDVAPAAPDPAVETAQLLDETVYLAVPTTSGIESLSAAHDAPWIAATPGTLCHTVTLRLGQGAGYEPRIRHRADDFTAVLALVGAGLGVAIVPELAAAEQPGVRLVPLATRRRTRTAWRRGTAAHPVITAARTALDSAAVAFRA